VFSQAQRIVLAQTKLELAGAAPDLHNMYEVYRDMYEALGVRDVDRLMKRLPDEEPKPTDPAQENIDSLDMITLKAFEGQEHQAHIMSHLVFGASPMVASLPPVAIALQKHVLEHVKLQAMEEAMAQRPQNELQYEALVAQGVAAGMQQVRELSAQISGANQPDPLVQLKEQELQIRAQSEQADTALDQAKLQLDAQNQEQRQRQFNERIASQERQTAARIDAGLQRELLKRRQ
jgi:hypothetical protein